MIFKPFNNTSAKMNNSLSKKISIAVLAASLSFSAAVIAKDSLYAQGQKQLDERSWVAAQKTFKSLINKKTSKQDAALYWLAYAQFHNSQNQAALKTVSRLSDDFPKSRWLDDAEALAVEIKDRLGDSAEINDDEMKLYAIDSLMNSSSKKTIPLLTKIINGKSSSRIKKRALFVLSQTESPEAFETIANLAINSKNETLQKYAIETLGVSGSKQAVEKLRDIYGKTDVTNTKLNILNSLMVADESDLLTSLARTEKQAELKNKAIRMLGVMSENQTLKAMYSEKGFTDYRESILHSLAIGDGADEIFEIVNSEKDRSLTLAAIRKIGILGENKVGSRLTELYKNKSDVDVRIAIIHALFIQSNAKSIIALLKEEKDPALKRQMLRKLSLMGDDESVDFFGEILDGEGLDYEVN